MKRIIMAIISILLTFLLAGCTLNGYASDDNELNLQIKEIIANSDFWYSFYTGNYYFPTDNIEVSENGNTFKSFRVEYSRIPSGIGLNFDNIEQYYSTDTYYADMPFKNLAEMKEKIEYFYTQEWAEKSLYNIYDFDYLEYDNMLLRSFDRDTIYGSADYNMLKITSVSDEKITAELPTYYMGSNEPEIKKYNLKFDNGTWKIDSIVYLN